MAWVPLFAAGKPSAGEGNVSAGKVFPLDVVGGRRSAALGNFRVAVGESASDPISYDISKRNGEEGEKTGELEPVTDPPLTAPRIGEIGSRTDGYGRGTVSELLAPGLSKSGNGTGQIDPDT